MPSCVSCVSCASLFFSVPIHDHERLLCRVSNTSHFLVQIPYSAWHQDQHSLPPLLYMTRTNLSPLVPSSIAWTSLYRMPPTRTENKSLRDPHHSTSLQKLLTTNKSLDSLLSELRNYDISKRLKVGQWCAGGGYADVYDGQLKLRKRDEGGREKESIKVAVKRFRPFVNADPDSAKVRHCFIILDSTTSINRSHS